MILVLLFGLTFTCSAERSILFNETSAFHPVVNVTDPLPRYVVASDFGRGQRKDKPVITIPMMTEFGGAYVKGYQLVPKSIEIALNQLHKDPSFLPGYELAFEVFDGKCKPHIDVGEAFSKIIFNEDENPNRLPLYVTSTCAGFTEKVIIRVMPKYNYITVTMIDNDPGINYEQIVSGMTRYRDHYTVADAADIFYYAIANFMKKMNWNKIAIFSSVYTPGYTEVEQFWVSYLNTMNITLVGMAKVREDHPEELENILLELKTKSPRIFLSHVMPVETACLFYRVGFVGPAFVIFVPNWSKFSPMDEIPTYLPWCKQFMLYEVMASLITFGYSSSLTDINENGDSTGLTLANYKKQIHQRVLHVDPDSGLFASGIFTYDNALLAGLHIHELAKIAKQENVSLLSWTVGSKEHQKKPKFIIEKIKEALGKVRLQGLQGVYQVDVKTGKHLGYTPVLFHQYLIDKRKQISRPAIGMYRNDLQKIFDVEPPVWKTVNGKTPRDSVLTIVVPTAPFATATFASFMTISAIGVVFCVVSAVLFVFKPFSEMASTSAEDFTILVGDILLLAHIFAIPTAAHIGSAIKVNCSVIIVLVLVGYSLAVIGMLMKLETEKLTVDMKIAKRNRETNNVGTDTITNKTWALRLLSLAWIAIELILLITLAIFAPVQVVSKINSIENSKTDSSIVYEFLTHECKLADDFLLPSNPMTMAIALFLAVSLGGINLRLIFLGFVLRLMRPKEFVSPEMLSFSKCVYYEMLILLAGIIVSMMAEGNGSYLMTVIASIAICFVLVNVASLLLGKFSKSVQIAPATSTANARRLSRNQSRKPGTTVQAN